MKRVLMIALVAAGVCGLLAVAQDEVTSINAVGYVKIALANELSLVRDDFVEIDDAVDATPAAVLGDQLPVNSIVYKWNGASYDLSIYEAQNIGTPFAPQWVTNWTSDAFTLDPGYGFWVKIPAESVPAELTLMGQVPNNPTNTVPVAEGLNLVGYSYPAAVTWTETDLAQKAAEGDIVYVWQDAGGYALNLYEARNIGTPFAPQWVTNWTDTNMVIGVGEGFWYKRAAGGGQVDWIEQRPYSL